MQTPSPHLPLAGMRALVAGIANADSIAYGCACAFRELGAQLAVTYLNEKAKPYVEPLAGELGSALLLPLDVADDAQMDAVFEAIRSQWGSLDIVLHSIAHAPKADLRGGLLDSSAQGFAEAMDVSCHSFIRMAKRAAPLMPRGGTLFAMSYDGANRVVPNYSLMGPVKAALEASCRYLACELGPLGIRVHAISPGPLRTRAASGIPDFDRLLADSVDRAPLGEAVDIMDVGFATAYLATRYARRMSGNTVYIDGGAHVMA
ncbi:enoyl-[acyl-carrier-protein] reductase FabI [Burkholderia sp. WAC0059]|uniref:enoyl-ACP reductase FabI n=1 Tax=Burkholderia sp. WAC0059 TaxID=2066022 RepID=UPI000C7F2C1E|nr:enoyl-ACP reductase FabI [Burkholderia sp. WAC0059]PLZ02244.1 enoyl-[acyl-carrier-protein] reductase FabI [Burkholderia sp. WAC0059]